jgi:hypothetical protein
MSRLVDAPTPKPAKQFNPAGTPRFAAGFPFENAKGAFRGLPMLTAEKCRDRAADCQKMAERAPSARVRDILLDMGRTWTRLAFEAEQWTQTMSGGADHQGCCEKPATGANAADPICASGFEAKARFRVGSESGTGSGR